MTKTTRFQTLKRKNIVVVVDTFFKKNEPEYVLESFKNTTAGIMEAQELMHKMNNRAQRIAAATKPIEW